jgi:hypothetical protein
MSMRYQIAMWKQLGCDPEQMRLCLRQRQMAVHNGRVQEIGRPASLDYELMHRRIKTLAASLADEIPSMIRAYAPTRAPGEGA